MKQIYSLQGRRFTLCQADDDGDCKYATCPQLRDGEPAATGRHCPLDNDEGAPTEAATDWAGNPLPKSDDIA